MTELEKKIYESMNNLQLVELLLATSEQASDEKKMRDTCELGSDSWTFFNDRYYSANELLIDIKYMVVGRMGGCTGKGKDL